MHLEQSPLYNSLDVGTARLDGRIPAIKALGQTRLPGFRCPRFVLADGSVQFISQNMDGVMIDRIADRADGQVVALEQ